MDSSPEKHALFSQEEIKSAVDRLAEEINRDYQGKNPVLIGVLKGVFIFMADLVRRLNFAVEIDLIRLSSYGNERESSRNVRIVHDLQIPPDGRDVLVIEDIIDTGLTVSFLLDYLKEKNPGSVRLCTLLDKPSRRKAQVNIDYVGLTVPDRFVIGYGLDCNEQYRNLPDIWYLED